jgi:glycerol-3-phosphate acyltransferase PlsX
MGSDTSPEVLLKAVLALAYELKDSIDLFVLAPPHILPQTRYIQAIPVEDFIAMNEDPLTAVRKKKEASLCKGMRMLQEGKLDAFVSAGNTGALMACAKLYLRMIPPFRRPALLALLPTKKQDIAVLDVGANVSCTVQHLLQFAKMGIAFQ